MCTHCGPLVNIQRLICGDVDPRGRRDLGPIHLPQQIEQTKAGTHGSSAATVFVLPSVQHVPSVW